jgi:hypothetical protein
VFLVSWVGIALTHYALVPEDRARGPEFRALRLPRATWGLAAWVIAAGTGIYCAEGPGIPALLAEGAPAVALVLSVVLYAVAVKARPLAAPAAADPRLEVEDAAATRAECHRCAKSYVVLEMDREPAAGDAPVCDGCATATLARRR